MLKILREYINYKLKAKGRHGVHSPFVYDFVDACLRKKVPENIFNRFKNYKNELKQSNTSILVTDLGAGSKRLNNQRRIKDIARVSGVSMKYGKLLFKIANHYQPNTILELGTSLGIGTFMLANGNLSGNVITVEGCPATSLIAKKKHREFQSKNVDFVVSDFVSFLKKYEGPKFDFVFIDGDHKGEKLLEQLELLDDHINEETIILLDDIRWNNDMLNAWNEIIQKEKHHLSIDLFKMGIIMLRNHQEKEHFLLRY